MYRRHDHVMRDFCTGIERALEAGWIDTQLAARRMCRHGVPLDVALRVVRAAMS